MARLTAINVQNEIASICVFLASAVPRFLVIHTAKAVTPVKAVTPAKAVTLAKAGAPSLIGTFKRGDPNRNHSTKHAFWSDFLERKDARSCVSTCQQIETRRNLARHFRIPFVCPTMFF